MARCGRTGLRLQYYKAFVFGCALLFSLAVFHMLSIQDVESVVLKPDERKKPNRYPKLTDKPAGIKTIKSTEGDVIDCVDIYRQPAFRHPLLHSHKIQMEPSSLPVMMNTTGYSSEIEISQEWHLSGKCPEGTIPIQRLPKAYIRSSSQRNHRKIYPPIATDRAQTEASTEIPHEHAVVYKKGNYFGAKASINVWNPSVEGKNEFSLAQIWVLSKGHINSVEAGWTVHPSLYGDHKTRFFAFWTADHYNLTGCYNLHCPGFVQTNKDIPLDFAINPFSTFGGQQYYITVEIFMDKHSGNWWLFVQGKQIGYWPGELLPALNKGSYMIEWGGEVVNAGRKHHTSTQMGSGHFPEEGYQRSSYFRDIQVVDGFHTYRTPVGIDSVVGHPDCYALRIGGHRGHVWGTYIYYGGPGRSPDCP